MTSSHPLFMLRLREPLEASWDKQPAFGGVAECGNAALGQCYPTARVVQHFFPASELVKGVGWTGKREEVHFWNALPFGTRWYYIDLSWQQFPPGFVKREFRALDRYNLGDSEATIQRCARLLSRVVEHLAMASTPFAVNGSDL